MATDSQTAPLSAPRGPAPLAPNVRHRVTKTFEHAQRCVEKGDHDYATELFTQCVAEDPGNVVFLQAFLGNLHKKYKDNKKGASFAATMFYADIVGAPGDPAIDRAIEELDFHCKQLRILGSYPQARPRG